MRGENERRIAPWGLFLCLVVLGFSDTARAQSITLSANALTFGNVQGGSASQSQTVHVSTSSDPSTVIVQVSGFAPWIKIAEAYNGSNSLNTPVDLHVSVDATTLTQGSHSGTVTVSFGSIPSVRQTLTVEATVFGISTLSANPAFLSFTSQAGAAPNTQNVQISSAAQQLDYTVSAMTQDGHNWLIPFTTSGTTGAPGITVGVNPAGLSAGVYQGTILAQSASTADSVAINVTMTLSINNTLSVAPTTLQTFLYQVGSNPPSGQLTQTLMVSSSNVSVTFTVVMNPSVGWLLITPASGATGNGGQAVPVGLSVNPTGLSAGVYTTQVNLGLTNGVPLPPMPVELVVSTNPLLSLSQSTLSFTSQFGGGTLPPSQPVQVSTLNGGSSVSFSYRSDSSWLTATVSSFNTPAIITVDVNASNLAVGTYQGTIIVTPYNSDAGLYSLPISVSLTVGNASQVSAAPPLLVFSYETTQAPPQAQVLQIQSIGQPVAFNVSTSTTTAANCPPSWLNSTSSSGPTLPVTPNTLTVSVVVTGMTPGTCSGAITISYPAGSLSPTNVSIPVTVNISTSALLNVSMPLGFGIATVPTGGNALTQGITLTSTDPLTQVTFSASSSSSGPSPWLFVGSNGLQTPQTLQVQIIPDSLPPNTYTGSITISSTSLPSGPITIPITLTMTSSIVVTVAPQTLIFSQAHSGPLPPSQSVTLTSSAVGPNFQVLVPNTATCGWLQVNPTSGPAAGTVIFAAQQNTLPQNTYPCQVTFSFGNSATPSTIVTATLTVGPPQTASVTPTSVAFSYQLTGSAPPSQALAVSSTAAAVNFTAAASSTGNWLVIDGTSGSTPKTINASVNPQNIPAGTQAGTQLTGIVTIAAPNVLAAPLTVNVTLSISAAPVPQPVTIVNSASITFGEIAPGELIAIKGPGLGPSIPANFDVNAQGGVSATLSGVQVLFDGIAGTPTFASATQINVIVPYEIAGRISTNVIVSFNGVPSLPISQQVAAVAPGIFTMNATGQGQAWIGNQNYSTNGPPGGVTLGGTFIPTTPATQGSVVAVYMTGGGQTSPLSATGSVNSLIQLMPLAGWTQASTNVTAKVNGVPATVTFAGAAPGLVTGVIQVNFQIPSGVSGNSLPLSITIDGATTAVGPTMAVQ
jgi:uncharacterized protein (TIGR03437 family)